MINLFSDAIIWILSAAAVFGGIWFTARKDVTSKIEKETLEQTLENIRKRQEIKRDVEILDDDDLANRARRWMREGDR